MKCSIFASLRTLLETAAAVIIWQQWSFTSKTNLKIQKDQGPTKRPRQQQKLGLKFLRQIFSHFEAFFRNPEFPAGFSFPGSEIFQRFSIHGIYGTYIRCISCTGGNLYPESGSFSVIEYPETKPTLAHYLGNFDNFSQKGKPLLKLRKSERCIENFLKIPLLRDLIVILTDNFKFGILNKMPLCSFSRIWDFFQKPKKK